MRKVEEQRINASIFCYFNIFPPPMVKFLTAEKTLHKQANSAKEKEKNVSNFIMFLFVAIFTYIDKKNPSYPKNSYIQLH